MNDLQHGRQSRISPPGGLRKQSLSKTQDGMCKQVFWGLHNEYAQLGVLEVGLTIKLAISSTSAQADDLRKQGAVAMLCCV